MKLNISVIVILLAFSLFCGVFIISLGIGSEFTAVNTIMSPLVCGTEKMEVAWKYNVAHPGQTFFGSRWLCVDETSGAAQDASTKTTLISGVVYGLLIFAIFIFWGLWMHRSSQNRQ
jgi:hypothetical protein